MSSSYLNNLFILDACFFLPITDFSDTVSSGWTPVELCEVDLLSIGSVLSLCHSVSICLCIPYMLLCVYIMIRSKVPRISSQFGGAKGFTIVELLIVILIIAVLAAITFIAYTGLQNRAREAAIASKESQIRKKLEVQKVAVGQYPSSQSEFDTLVGQTPGSDYYTTYSSSPPHDAYTISTSGRRNIALNCPAGFITVPGNGVYGTSDFCVMKYEAKNVNGTAVSQASGSPWSTISYTAAQTAAQGACSNCKLITDAQWMTIATNILSVGSNWSGGVVGSGYVYSGHNDNSPANPIAASSNDQNGYEGTGNTVGNQRRTLTLTNGEVIWDFASNLWEWTDGGTMKGGQPGVAGESSYTLKNYNNPGLLWNNLPSTSRPTGTLYPMSQGVGGIFTNAADNNVRAFLRGGCYRDGSSVGVLSLALSMTPNDKSNIVGFRSSR